MADAESEVHIEWYRVKLDKDTLRGLTQRSDLRGAFQALGFLVLLAITAAAVFYAWRNFPVWALILTLFVHGTLYAFLLNAFHELVHGTVFRSKWLNALFLRVYSFLSWNSHVSFRASHTRHHLYTLHPPSDGEVVLPIHLSASQFGAAALIDPLGLFMTVKGTVWNALGGRNSTWEDRIFPVKDRRGRRRLMGWAWVLLVGHAVIVTVSLLSGFWIIAVLTTGARFYGGWLQWLCNSTQHVGLRDRVPDFRLCCRTIRLNPVIRFLYFHMNFHTEHHMYASVPCYNLGRLRRIILSELPPARGLSGAWQEIVEILRIQKRDSAYQHTNALPPLRGS